MSLKKKAIEGVVVAGSLVMMSAIADTADMTAVTASSFTEETTVNGASGRTAGVIAQLDQAEAEAFAEIGEMPGSVTRSGTVLVTTAEGPDEGQPVLLAVEEQPDAAPKQDTASQQNTLQLQAGATAEVQPGADIPQDSVSQADAVPEQDAAQQPKTEQPQDTAQPETEQPRDTVQQPDTEVQPKDAAAANMPEQPAEDAVEWQNRLMPDVQEFLYVREAGDENASVVGKLYKGDVAEIVERGEAWTHVVSGNVDGYVLNSYCLFGTDAMNYAKETFDIKAEIMTNGLRVRRSADTEGAVIAAVSTGTFLTVDPDAAAVDGWVAVSYGGETGYVSAEYVTTELALGEGITIEEERAAAAKAAEEAAAAKAAQVSSPGTVQNAAVAASVDDVTLLAALIQCEAGSEPYEGQLAVGAVVMNRVRSGGYPGSVHDVIYQSGQFTPAGRGSVANVAANGPKASCIQAAQEAINGMDNTGGAVRFRRASSGQPGVVIGNHVFY